MSWFKEDPAQIIASLQMPVLIVQGKSDIQVSMKDAKILHKANPKSTLLAIDQMTHVLKIVRESKDISPTITYEYPDFPLSTKLVDGILSFLKNYN
jgi:esterase/lipase